MATTSFLGKSNNWLQNKTDFLASPVLKTQSVTSPALTAGNAGGSNNGKLLGGLGYMGHKLGLGVLSTIEGIWDYSASGVAKVFGGDAWAERKVANDWVNYNAADEWFDPGTGWKVAGDVSSGIGTSLTAAVPAAIGVGITIASGGTLSPVAYGIITASSAVIAGGGAAGNSLKEAYQDTGELTGKEYAYGAGVGLVEGGIEAVSNLIGVGTAGRALKELGEGVAKGGAKAATKTAVKSTAKAVGKNATKKVLRELGEDFASEAIEEAISEWASPYIARATYDPNAENATAGEIAYAAIVGGISGAIMSGGRVVAKSASNYAHGNKLINDGKADQALTLGKYFAESEQGTASGISSWQQVSEIYNELKSTVPDGTDIQVSDLTSTKQKMLLGALSKQSSLAAVMPEIERSAINLVMHPEQTVQTLNEYGKIAGNAVTFTVEQLLEGVDTSDLNSKQGYQRFRRSLHRALSSNGVLALMAVADATGRLTIDTMKFSRARAEVLRAASATDLNRFRETATQAELDALGKRLKISNWDVLTDEQFHSSLDPLVETEQDVEKYIATNRRFSDAKAALAEDAKPMPHTLRRNMNDGTYRFESDGARMAIIKEGESYYIVDYDTEYISWKLTVSEVNRVLRQIRDGVASSAVIEQMQGAGNITENADENARLALAENGKKRYNKRVPISNDFLTNAMMWAHSDGVNVGEQRTFTDGALTVLIEKTEDGYKEIKTVSNRHSQEIASIKKAVEKNNADLYATLYSSIDAYESDGRGYQLRSGADVGESQSDGQNGSVYQGTSASDSNRSLERGSENQRSVNNGVSNRAAIGVWARENVPGYDKLADPAKTAVRATIRQARALGISEENIKLYASVAARSGLNVVFDVTVQGDALYDGRNTIYVDPNAPVERMRSKLLLHEGGHALFARTSKGRRLLDAAYRAIEKNNPDRAKEIRERYEDHYAGSNLSAEILEGIIKEEQGAAYLEDVLGEVDAWSYILAEEPQYESKLIAFFAKAAQDYKHLKGMPAEARKLLRQYKKLFAELSAYNQGNNALDTRPAETEKAVTRMNDENMQVTGERAALVEKAPANKIVAGMSDKVRAEILRTRSISLHEAVLPNDFDIEAKQLERNMKSAVEKPLIQKLRTLGVLKRYHTNSVDVEFEFTGEGARKSMNSQVSDYGGNLADLAKVMMNMQSLLDSAVLLEIHPDKAKGTPKENARLRNTYVLLSAFAEDGVITPVQFEIKEYVDNNNRLYLAVALTKIKTGVMGDTAQSKEGRTHLLPVSIISIPDLLKKINPRDENFFKYAPDEFLSEEQLNAKRRALEKERKKYQKFVLEAEIPAKEIKRLALPEDGGKAKGQAVTMSKGEIAKLHANYAGEKVFDKKSVTEALSNVEAFQKLSPAIRRDFVDRVWTGYNQRLHKQGFELFTEVMWHQLHATILQEGAFAEFESMTEDEIAAAQRKMDEQIVGALRQIVASGKPSIKAKLESDTSTEGYRKQANYWKAEHDRVIERNKLLGRVKQEVEKLANLKAGRYVNAAHYRGNSFSVAITELAKMNWRGGLVRDQKIREHFASIAAWYVKDNPLYKSAEGGNELFRADIKEALDALGNAQNGALTNEDLLAAEVVIKYFAHEVEAHNTVYKNGKRVDATPEAKRYIANVERVRHVSARGRLTRSGFARMVADPATLMRQADGYQDGFFTEQFEELRRGTIDANVLERELSQTFENFWSEHKSYGKRYNSATVTYQGKQVPLQEALSLYMTMKREQAYAGLAGAGFEIDGKDGKENVSDGFADKVEEQKKAEYKNLPPEELLTLTKEGHARIERIALQKAMEAQRKELYDQFTDEDRALISIMEKTLEQCRDVKVEIDQIVQGYSNVTGGYYFPIKRTGLAENVDAFTGFEGDRVSNLSINKDTVKNAHKLYIEPAHIVFMRHLKAVSLYHGLGVFTDNFNRLYNLNISESQAAPLTIRDALGRSNNYTKEMLSYFKELKQDVEGISKKRNAEKFYNDAVAYIRSTYATYQLGANPKVWVTQLSSLIAASNILDADCIVKGVGVRARGVDEYCRLAWLRNNDNAAAMAQAVSTPQNAVQRAGRGALQKVRDVSMLPIGKVDRFVVTRLFAACQVQVEKNGGAKIGTEVNKKAAGELLTRVILETQQNSLVTERSAAMRSGDELLKGSTMFSADAMKVGARLLDAAGEYRALNMLISDESGKGTPDQAELKRLEKRRSSVKKQAVRATAAIVGVALFNAALAYGFKWLYRRDEDEDLGTFFADTVGNMLGGIPFVRDAWGFFQNGFEMDHFLLSTINDLLGVVTSSYDLLHAAVSGEEITRQQALSNMRKVLYAAGQLTGVPVRNIYNVSTGMINRVSPKTGTVVDGWFYQKNYRTDLQRALDEDDHDTASFMLGLLLDEQIEGGVSEKTRTEMLTLLKGGYSVLPRSVPTEYSYEGETFELDEEQQAAISAYYATLPSTLDALLARNDYQRLTAEQRAMAFDHVYDAYRELGISYATGANVAGNKTLIASALGVETLALSQVVTSGIRSDVGLDGKAVAGSKRKKTVAAINTLNVPVEQKLLLICARGYSLRDGDLKMTAATAKKKLLRYILALKVSKAEKMALAEMCGFEVKNGRIVTENAFK